MSHNPNLPARLTVHPTSNVFLPQRSRFQASVAPFLNALLATALFRCWHILLFFAAWATLISILNEKGHKLFMQPTLLTVIGTVVGVAISLRTSSSCERYNESRRLWSQVILASHSFARTTWFHVPDQPAMTKITADEIASRSMIERKSVINLLEAYAVSVKHYLRGEDGIYYEDLYHLVKFLPAYAPPTSIPPPADCRTQENGNGSASRQHTWIPTPPRSSSFLYQRNYSEPALPLPGTTLASKQTTFIELARPQAPYVDKTILSWQDEEELLPARMPPKYQVYDLFPFTLLANWLTKRGRRVKGKRAAKIHATMQQKSVAHYLPLEISFFLSSYIAALQKRNYVDPATINNLMQSLSELVVALAGLERIHTDPIPFSYSVHLWVVTLVYCFFLPFQIWGSLGWLTIPGTVIPSFLFFGFLVAGEEIENPFGYDKNDLDLDHFTNIICNELRAITSAPPPDPARWAFSAENDLLFSNTAGGERVSPLEWMERGPVAIQKTLSVF